jgi:hypothetical protein
MCSESTTSASRWRTLHKANHFYGEVLGLKGIPNSPDEDWIECETGTPPEEASHDAA